MDAAFWMIKNEIITRDVLKWYFRASRHIDPQKLRACVADMANLCNDLHRLDRAYFKQRM